MLRVAKTTIVVMLAVLTLGLAFGAGMGFPQATASPGLAPVGQNPGGAQAVGAGEVPLQLSTLLEAWDILEQDHVDRSRLDWEQLGEGTIRGLLEALGDPHTSYIDPLSYRLETTGHLGGDYEGIGAVVDQREGKVIIVSPIEGSPASRAGIRPGDQILAVDGMSIEGLSLGEVIVRIRGPAGTNVTLTIQHEGEPTPVSITLTRDRIQVSSVRSELKADNIGYVQITTFSSDTPQELISALRDLRQQGARGLVLDLRGNPGGFLDATVQATSQFLKNGVVLYEESASGERKTWPVNSGGVATDLPMAVLIDQGSASGSEVMAGALQDHGRAVLMGTTTYGKGAVNIFRELSNGGALYVTIARWLTPNGRQIEGTGLSPDIEMFRTQEDIARGLDPPLEAAMDYVKKRL
ncbi:MAG: S41 family peptidase [Chloroflexi bacterium]|nr:S41 family peptidase [Chloroflexota bacterium]